MAEPTIAARKPAKVELEAGKTYLWCACGRSKNQPFCDGSHAGSEWTPLVFKAEKTETAMLCQCKRTGNKPRCDGTHAKLPANTDTSAPAASQSSSPIEPTLG